MHTFIVIADDFTGANDTGVQICKRGLAVDVVVCPKTIADNEDSIVIDTESRVIPANEAYARITETVQQVLDAGGCQYLYKKVDSTLRGHLQEEIKAVVQAYMPDTIIFAPAYAAQGRTVEQGRLCVYGTPLLDTEIAKDPRNPLIEDNITAILKEVLSQPIIHYDRNDIASGTIVISDGAYTFDSTTQQELQEIAAKSLQSKKKILWIGSAGLAAGLLAVTCPVKPSMAVVGSISHKTMEQIAYCQAHGDTIIKIDMEKVYETKDIRENIAAAVAALQRGEDVILTAATCRDEYDAFVAYGKKKNLTTDFLADFAKRMLSTAVPSILAQTVVAGLFLTGGDTAIAVIDILKAQGARIQQELLPGFVQSRLRGGPWQNLPVVTKAGAFGTPADIYTCMEKIKGIV